MISGIIILNSIYKSGMRKVHRFKVSDCYNRVLATFSIPEKCLPDFINDSEVKVGFYSVQMCQRYFWYLAKKYCSYRAYAALERKLHGAIDAYFYLSYE